MILSMGTGLIDDFIRNILSVPFCPYHFVHTILSDTILSVPFCPYHFVRYHFVCIPFCPYYFVRYHFVLEPLNLVLRASICFKTHEIPGFKTRIHHPLRFQTRGLCMAPWLTNILAFYLFQFQLICFWFTAFGSKEVSKNQRIRMRFLRIELGIGGNQLSQSLQVSRVFPAIRAQNYPILIFWF